MGLTYIVNSTADHSDGTCTGGPLGDCTLREAIEATNATPDEDDRIMFSLGGPGVPEIVVGTPLPEIVDRVSIDGEAPGVRLHGTAAAGDGLLLRSGAAESELNRLTIIDFPGNGIEIDAADGVEVFGSFIGTVDGGAGSPADGNGGHGIAIRDAGQTDIERNRISGNEGDGVRATGAGSTGTRIESNTIGSEAQNEGSGLTLDGSPAAVVISNLIAGNGTHGVHLVGSDAGGALLEDNLIGTSGLPNSRTGLFLDGVSNTVVGGVTTLIPPRRANLIIGNGGDGVRISGVGATGNTFIGNRIGENDGTGVVIEDGANNEIGSLLSVGPPAGATNFIYLNGAHGVRLTGSATGNLIQGNAIGTGLGGMVDFGNSLDGVAIEGASGNSVGGEGGKGNLIVYNMRGVHITGGARNPILGNSIHSNDSLGIDLSPPLVNPIDAGDTDFGPNELQNFPTITAATTASGSTTIAGRLDSAGGARYRLELFASDACDASGHGEGAERVGSRELTTEATGRADFTVTMSPPVAVGRSVTATATDAAGNTSEFSACAVAAEPAMPVQAPNARPRLLGASISNRVLRVGRRSTPRRGVAGRVPVGTTFRYRLSESAQVRISIDSRRRGRRGGRARWVRQGTLARRSGEGRNRVRFSGRIGRRALRPGRQRATLVATDRLGARSRPVRLRFRVVAP